MDSKQSYQGLPAPGYSAAQAQPRHRKPWRRTAALVSAVTALTLMAGSYRAATSAPCRGAFGHFIPTWTNGATPAAPAPQCPAQLSIAPSTRPDITEHNIEQLFKSAAFRNLTVDRLAGAVQVPTQDFEDMGLLGEDPRWDTFYDFQAYIKKAFPVV